MMEGFNICIICLEFQKDKLTANEAYRAMLEVYTSGELEAEHVEEIISLIDKQEKEEAE